MFWYTSFILWIEVIHWWQWEEKAMWAFVREKQAGATRVNATLTRIHEQQITLSTSHMPWKPYWACHKSEPNWQHTIHKQKAHCIGHYNEIFQLDRFGSLAYVVVFCFVWKIIVILHMCNKCIEQVWNIIQHLYKYNCSSPYNSSEVGKHEVLTYTSHMTGIMNMAQKWSFYKCLHRSKSHWV